MQSSTAIDLGFIQIKWYSIFILLAMTAASLIVGKESKKKGLSKDTYFDMIFYGLIFGILGARLYYVLFNFSYYIKQPLEILATWHGGLAIHGGLIATLLFLVFYTKKKNLNLLLLLDIIVVGLILGQAIGRWGNFFNGEAYGGVIAKSVLQNMHLPKFIINGMYIDGAYHHPTFLYESICSLIGFGILLFARTRKSLTTGRLTSIYLVWYGSVRLIIESLRTDSLMLGDIRMAQMVSLICILSGLIIWAKSENHKKYNIDKIQTK